MSGEGHDMIPVYLNTGWGCLLKLGPTADWHIAWDAHLGGAVEIREKGKGHAPLEQS